MRPWSHATLRRFLLSARLAPTTQAPCSTPSGDIPQAHATGTYDDAMADRLENIDATAASPAPGTDGAISTPLPPPRPKSVENGPDLKRQRILAVIGAIALLAAVVLALLWVSALSSRDTATTERDAAQAAATEEAERTADALDSLAATEVNLETALADNEQLAAELAAAEGRRRRSRPQRQLERTRPKRRLPSCALKTKRWLPRSRHSRHRSLPRKRPHQPWSSTSAPHRIWRATSANSSRHHPGPPCWVMARPRVSAQPW